MFQPENHFQGYLYRLSFSLSNPKFAMISLSSSRLYNSFFPGLQAWFLQPRFQPQTSWKWTSMLWRNLEVYSMVQNFCSSHFSKLGKIYQFDLGFFLSNFLGFGQQGLNRTFHNFWAVLNCNNTCSDFCLGNQVTWKCSKNSLSIVPS